MFDMTGHKIEITGLRSPNPHDEEVMEESGVDISDLGMINKLFKDCKRRERASDHNLTPEMVSMVVWGEDLARIPLIVFSAEGEVLCYEPSMPYGCFEQYRDAAKMINMAMMSEQQLAAEN